MSDSSTVLDFLAAVRTRLWRNNVVAAATLGLWVASLTLLWAGGLHVGVAALPLWVTVAGGVTVFVLTLAAGLARRPSLRAAARTADRRLGGRALLTTALQCVERSTGAAAGVCSAAMAS